MEAIIYAVAAGLFVVLLFGVGRGKRNEDAVDDAFDPFDFDD
jgi:hypothetical protein